LQTSMFMSHVYPYMHNLSHHLFYNPNNAVQVMHLINTVKPA